MALLTYASPMEEQVIEKAIKESIPWEQLPKRLKLFVGSSENYIKAIRKYCMNARLRWEDSPAANFCKESEYYDEMIKHLRQQQSPFPYHLADFICRFMRISPFKYYSELLLDVMKAEKSYDTIPNFTAADALRETGVGRNQFIEIMNKTRSKLMWRLNRGIVKDMLPSGPATFPLQPWWHVRTVNFAVDEYRKLSEEEVMILERGGSHGSCLLGEFEDEVVRNLYAKGLVYFDVPVFPKDRFRMSSLEGFVSNRNQQHEDATEKLLYALFVTSSEQATVEEMAATLQADVHQLSAAISLACRLGWAEKVFDIESILDEMTLDRAAAEVAALNPFSFTGVEYAAPVRSDGISLLGGLEGASPLHIRAVDRLRIALMVDANLTSFLMMGSFSYELKQQAVTLFEAGKLGERSVAELCGELRVVERTRLEGELKKFTEHAFSLRCALSCLRTASLEWVEPSSASASSSARSDSHSTFKESAVERDNQRPTSQDDLNAAGEGGLQYQGQTAEPEFESEQGGLGSEGATPAKKREAFNRVEMLRCESLAGLPPTTLQRLLERDYNIIVSIVPLPNPLSMVAAHGGGPVHFGPPAPAFLTPWAKLLMYSLCCAGPVSLALVQGQRLRQLPPPLAGCSHAIVWTWDGSSMGGAGAHIQGITVKGAILLHVLNNLLRTSAVLVQPISEKSASWDDATESPAVASVPLPVANSRVVTITESSQQDMGQQQHCLRLKQRRQAAGSQQDKAQGTLKAQEVLSDTARTSFAKSENAPATFTHLESRPDGGDNSCQAGRPNDTESCDAGLNVQNASTMEAHSTDPSAAFVQAKPGPSQSAEAVSGETLREEDWGRHWSSLDSAVKRVVQDLSLHAVGFLRMMQVDAVPATATTAENSSSRSLPSACWVPHSVEFGIPMYDAKLCTQVCESIVTEGMLNQKELELQQAASQLLRSTLCDFIADYKEHGPIAQAVRQRSASKLRSTAHRWNGGEHRPTYNVLAAHPVVVPAPSGTENQAGAAKAHAGSNGLRSYGGQERLHHPAFRSQRLSTPRTQFWFLPENFGTRGREPSTEAVVEPDSLAADEELLSRVALPGLNLIFDGRVLLPIDISTHLQGFRSMPGLC